MVRELFLAWQNNVSREWTPVGRLRFDNEKYIFNYTKGAQFIENFVPFGRMTELDNTYESKTLFPIFQNRLLTRSRPEYEDYLNWLNLVKGNFSSLDELARAGGIRATDSLELFPKPEKKNGAYEVSFFSHGIRHLPSGYIDRVNHLNYGNKLYLLKDVQNQVDCLALALRTEDPPEIVGYCPRYYVQDFNTLLDLNGPGEIKVYVEKVNQNCPHQFKLLCNFKTTWPESFEPFKKESFQPVSN